MTSLQRLHQMMAAIPTERHQFSYKINEREFDCLFWTGSPDPEQQPRTYELSLTSIGETPVHISFYVDKSYYVDTMMAPEVYRALATLLRIHGSSFQKFVPITFLAELNRHISNIHSLRPPPKTKNIQALNTSGPSTSEYFSHWQFHKPPRGPSAENREKTRRLMGKAGSDHSLQHIASSVWKEPKH